jgi:hypothetical protein
MPGPTLIFFASAVEPVKATLSTSGWAARAGPSFHAAINSGKFQGVI